jgi:hypothetical protein
LGNVVIDFENVPGVTPDPNFGAGSEVPVSARLSTQLLNSHGVRFSTESPNSNYVALVWLGQGHAPSGEHGIGGVSGTNRLNYAGPMLLSFFMPGNPTVPAMTDFFSILGDRFNGQDIITVQAYGLANNLLGTASIRDDGRTPFTISARGIHTVRITETVGEVALDDLTFSPLYAAPEPSTSVLLLIAVAGCFCQCARRYSRGTTS